MCVLSSLAWTWMFSASLDPLDLRQKFKDITKQFSPEQRPFDAHMTTAIVSTLAHSSDLECAVLTTNSDAHMACNLLRYASRPRQNYRIRKPPRSRWAPCERVSYATTYEVLTSFNPSHRRVAHLLIFDGSLLSRYLGLRRCMRRTHLFIDVPAPLFFPPIYPFARSFFLDTS